MKRLAYALAGVIALAAVLLVVFAPALVDTPAVRAEIQRRLAAALQGQVTWETLTLRLFPAPHGELRALRIDIPGRLAATADEVKLDMRLWPLLRGRAELTSVTLQKPSIELAPSGAARAEPPDPVAIYRESMPAVVRALQAFAPDTELRVEKAAFAELREIDLVARTRPDAVDLELAAASRFWKRLSAKGRLQYHDLAAEVRVEVEGLSLAPDVPAAELRVQLRAGPTAMEALFHARSPTLAAAQGKVVLAEGKAPHASLHVSALDLAQALAIARARLPRLDAIESAEGYVWASADAVLSKEWRADIEVTKSSGAVKLAALPWKIAALGKASLTTDRVQLSGVRGSIGDSTFEHASAEIVLGNTPRFAAASASATLSLKQWFPWLAARAPLEGIDSVSGKLDVKLKRLALSFDRPQDADFDALCLPRGVTVSVKALPGPLRVDSGQVAVNPRLVRVAGLRGGIADSRFAEVQAQIELKPAIRVRAAEGRATLALEQWFPWLARRTPLEEFDAMSGKLDVTLKRLALRFDRPQDADFEALVQPRGVSAALKVLPGPVQVDGGQVVVNPRLLRIAGLRGGIVDSSFTDVQAQIELKPAIRVRAAQGRATLALEQWFPMLNLAELTALSGKVDVDLEHLALALDRPQDAQFQARATPRQVSAALTALPAPVSVSEGTLHINRASVRIDGVAAQMLDLRTMVSGTVAIEKPALEIALSAGTLGEKALRWALERAEVPARFEPKAPFGFAARRIAWAPEQPLEADARIEFDGGPQLGIVLAWRPELLELRRVTIKDARSDATIGATLAGDLIQASFSGMLAGASIPAMLRAAPPASGVAKGALRVTIDRKQPERTQMEGKLGIEALDLTWLAGMKVLVERADIVAERDGARISGARFAVEDQFFELSGAGRRTSEGPVIEARITSDGVMLERLLPPADPSTPRKKSSALWPLPLAGRVELSAGFVQYKDYRIEPLEGVLALEPKRARVEVKRARMCGVSFPMELEFEPDSASAAARVSIENEPFERTVRCLTGGGVDMTGNATLKAELRTVGRRPHLVRGITGRLEAQVRQGRVNKFALLGNILSFRGIGSLGDPKAGGFPYRSITAKGRFDNGRFLVDESFFDSDAVRLAAQGHVDMLGADSRLTVLVGLLTHIDRLAGAIPIVGDIFGGSMTALPIAVHGDIRDPVIVPLGPRAVTDQLLGIFERTLKLPGKLVPAP